MTRYWWLVLAFVGGVLAGMALFGDDSEERDRLRAEAQRMTVQARALYQVALKNATRSDTAYVTQVERVTRVQRVTDSVLVVLERENPGCGNVVAACEARLQVERDTAMAWRRLFEFERDSVRAPLVTATDTALAAADTGIKAATISNRRSLWKILTRPEVQPGAFAGYCLTGQFCAGVGATLIWRF